MTDPTRVIIIDLNEARNWGDCCMCGQDRRLDHAVAYWCGPVHMEIGQTITLADGSEQTVGGMCVCKACHDQHYQIDKARAALSARSLEVE